jgi:hypothetical protein
MLGPAVALFTTSKRNWKGAYREYWRDGRQQKLLDLDGIVDRRVDGPAARSGWKLRDFRRAKAKEGIC